MSDWNIEKSIDLYGIKYWGADFFHVNEKGNVTVAPNKDQSENGIDLYSLTQDLIDRGIRSPILLRFPDIIRKRVQLLNQCFENAISEYGYSGSYLGVYPIKVNQQKHLVEEIVRSGAPYHLGLECGSKPELLVVLALMTTPDALIICNGFKDYEYIETAVLSQKLGRNTLIVIERMMELDLVIKAAEKFNVKPKIGLRAKLNSQGSGKWVESSGARSKFGLTPFEIVQCVETLKEKGLEDSIELLHFHIGSQIPSIHSIKASLKEAARFFAELYSMGACPKYLDVGGGLGVDYDGSGKTDSSTNYTEQEYANDVVSIIQGVCDEKKIPHPNIVTESGRALVAHSSVLLFNVLGVNELRQRQKPPEVSSNDHQILQDLKYMYESLGEGRVNEYYNDLMQMKQEILQLFTYGVLSLADRARAETYYWVIATSLLDIARKEEDVEDVLSALENELSDTYFCNFSIFQSVPDAWAVNHIFPILPIHRLNEEPSRRAILADLTCDSDGKFSTFLDIETGGTKKSLEVHGVKPGEPYFIGVFLTGAYQEILGDLHNLFGDTDAVHISMTEKGYSVDHVVQGDSVEEILGYVEYHKPELIEKIRLATEGSILRESITKQEARLLMNHYQEGLSGYTYFEDLD